MNRRVCCATKSFGDRAGLQAFGFHVVNLLVCSVALEFFRNLGEEELFIFSKDSSVARIGPDMFQVEAKDIVGYLVSGEANDSRNTSSPYLVCIIV